MHKFTASSTDLKNARFAHVLGFPIAHSLSPVIHNAAYKFLELPYVYSAIETTRQSCQEMFSKLKHGEVFGLSLTMPLKEEAFAFADIFTENCTKSKVANTLVYRDGQYAAENTDVFGISQLLKQQPALLNKPWTVLGTGATARSAICALRDLNVPDINVVGRSETKLAELELDFDVKTTPLGSTVQVENLISTLPALAQGDFLYLMKNVSYLLDVNYGSWPTVLASKVTNNNAVVVNGLPLLVYQAQLQIEIMTGQQVPIAVLFEAVAYLG
jgi:shikimate dehydrogenase